MPRRGPHTRRPGQDNPVVKLVFGLYQCLHHLSFLTGGGRSENARPFARKVEELDRFFIPALPNMNCLFKKRCHETNEKWRQEQIGNLREHYEWCIDSLKGSISAYHLTRSELSDYMLKAEKWAKQQFRRKFKSHLFGQVDQMVQKTLFPQTTAKDPGSSTSSKIQAEPAKAPEPAGISTPKRKRGASASPETSPTQTNTPKQRRISYAEKSKSPPRRTTAQTQKNNPAVTRFPNLKGQRGRNITNVWHIPKITKNILVLGDSLLARISFVQRRDVQVLSYPGLKLAQMEIILKSFQFGPKSTSPGQQPSHVVFVVGINNRGLASTTNDVELKKMINEAKRQFPNAKISIYQQPFDKKLPSNEVSTLRTFNDAIEKQCKNLNLNCIPEIPAPKFAVVGGHDHIHWTEDCANATVEHFLEHLN